MTPDPAVVSASLSAPERPGPARRLTLGLMLVLPLLVSCQGTRPGAAPAGAADASSFPAASSAVRKTVTHTPSKARPGARRIQYSLLEVVVPEGGPVPDFLAPHLKQPGGPPVPFPSLRELAQTKGVDLLPVGTAGEGQTVRTRLVTGVPVPTEFKPDGSVISQETRDTGVDASFRGRLEPGKIISVRADVEVSEVSGYQKFRLESGAEVVQPQFTSRRFRDPALRIPDGGFVLLPLPGDGGSQELTERRWGGLIRRTGTRKLMKYLAVAASTGGSSARAETAAASPATASR